MWPFNLLFKVKNTNHNQPVRKKHVKPRYRISLPGKSYITVACNPEFYTHSPTTVLELLRNNELETCNPTSCGTTNLLVRSLDGQVFCFINDIPRSISKHLPNNLHKAQRILKVYLDKIDRNSVKRI